jgi:Caspase domain
LIIARVPRLKVEQTIDLSNVPGQLSLCCFTWSADGKYLFAGGNFSGRGKTPIYRWDTETFSQRKEYRVSNHDVRDLEAIPGGRIVYPTTEPGLGIIDLEGNVQQEVNSILPDFRNSAAVFAVANDGRTVTVPVSRLHGRTITFSVEQLSYLSQRDAITPTAQSKISSNDFRYHNDPNQAYLEIGGKRVDLDRGELVRASSVDLRGKTLLVGTQWKLRAFNLHGSPLWDVRVPVEVFGAVISGDGRFAITTHSDGTVRWYHMGRKGQEVLALFLHRNGKEWVAWRPDGYYASSLRGDNFIGWLVNNNGNSAPDFVRALQLARVLFAPNLIDKQLDDDPPVAPARAMVLLKSVPKLHIAVLDERQCLTVTVSPGHSALEELTVFANSIPILPARSRALFGADRTGFRSKTICPDYIVHSNHVRIEVKAGETLGIAETHVVAKQIDRRKGRLHVVAVGVNNFPDLEQLNDPNIPRNLAFAVNDAHEVADLFDRAGTTTFGSSQSKVLSDNTDPPTKRNILAQLDALANSQAVDTTVVFLSSHGVSDLDQTYYLLPKDAAAEDIRKVLNSSSGGVVDSLVSWQEIFERLRQVTGKRVLIIDSCKARAAFRERDVLSTLKRSTSSHFAFLAASQINENAREERRLRHGLFTYHFLTGMEGKADRNNDSQITLSEMFTYLDTQFQPQGIQQNVRPTQRPFLFAPDSMMNFVIR